MITSEVVAVLDVIPHVGIVRALDGTILAWNPAAEAVFGWAAHEVVGRTVTELVVDPADRDAAGAVVALTQAGEVWRGDFEVRRRDGSRAVIDAHISPLRDEHGAVVATVCSATDVTSLRGAERRASDLSDHLVLALSAGQLGTFRWDRATGATTWDPTMKRLLGLADDPRDVFDYDDWVSSMHPDDAADAQATVQAAVEARSTYEVEHRVVWPDGTVRWIQGRGKVTVDDDGEPTGTIGFSTDVTHRKLAELEARRRIEEAESAAARDRLARERLEFLGRINDLAMDATDHELLMHTITAAAVPRLGDWCTIHFFPEPGGLPLIAAAHADPEQVRWLQELIARYPYDPDGPNGVAAVIRSGTPEFVQIDEAFLEQAVRESTTVPEGEAREIVDRLQLTSIVTVPLSTKRGVVGAVQFVSAESGRRYDADDLALAEAAAGRIGAALDNTWLSEQYRGVASALQEALLPVAFPTVPGLDLAVRYWAAGTVNEVGGDFYDVFESSPGRWSIVIGDVCGTGPQAAAVTAKARHTIRAAATHGCDPVETVSWVNQAILANNRGRFCTIAYSTIEAAGEGRWKLTSVAAGHPLPIIVDADGGATFVGRSGTLVGVLPELVLHVTETMLGPGDTLVAYTDGVTDVRPPHGIDDDHLLDLTRTAVVGSDGAEATADRLGESIDDVLPFSRRNDDMAIVVVSVAR